MDWFSIVMTGTVAGFVLFLLLGLTALVGFRRLFRHDAGTGRGARTVRQLGDAIGALQRHANETRAQMQTLARTQKRMAEELEALRERVGDGTGHSDHSGPPRLLH